MSDERIAALIEEGERLHQQTTQERWSQSVRFFIEDEGENQLACFDYDLCGEANAAFSVWAHENFKAIVAAVKEQGQWQPIETAPEATYVLVWLPNYGAYRAIRTERDWWAVEFRGEGCIVNPSHWMPDIAPPLPSPPAKEGNENGI